MKVSHHPRYGLYSHMMDRCYNINSSEYPNWGGRGIVVCEEWHDSSVFLTYLDEVLGDRPEGHTFDRIDNNGNYEPGNVRWATPSQQNSNRRVYELKNHKVSSTGVKWVYKILNKYYGKFQIKGKPYFTTNYNTIDEALDAVLQYRKEVMEQIIES